MQKVWRATAFLFWQHPALWLPVMIADAMAFALHQLQGSIARQIVLWVYQSHSVLSSAPDFSQQPSKMVEAAMLSAPFLWGTYYCSIFLYTSAMLVMANCMGDLGAARPLTLFGAASQLKDRVSGIAIFALKLVGLCICAAFLVAQTSGILTRVAAANLRSGFFYGLTIGFELAVVTCIIPSCLRMFRPLSSGMMREQVTVGQIYGAATVLASAAIGWMLISIHIPLWPGWQSHAASVHLVINALSSEVSALPYVLLFIALYLISTPESALLTHTDALGQDDASSGEAV